jgi:hypothetical protein
MVPKDDAELPVASVSRARVMGGPAIGAGRGVPVGEVCRGVPVRGLGLPDANAPVGRGEGVGVGVRCDVGSGGEAGVDAAIGFGVGLRATVGCGVTVPAESLGVAPCSGSAPAIIAPKRSAAMAPRVPVLIARCLVLID